MFGFGSMIDKLKKNPKKIVLTEGSDPRILEAASRLLASNFLKPILLGNEEEIFKASEDDTPFRKENIRMLREIGYFSIAVPVVGLIMSIVVRLVIGAEAAEISVGQGGIFMGIIVLCLTQYFVYGAELEKDVDGLL